MVTYVQWLEVREAVVTYVQWLEVREAAVTYVQWLEVRSRGAWRRSRTVLRDMDTQALLL